jgi:hypothetical protein
VPDKTIRCSDCGEDFIFSEGEQEFYAQKDFTPPKRCKSCRDKRKASRESRPRGGAGMRSRERH